MCPPSVANQHGLPTDLRESPPFRSTGSLYQGITDRAHAMSFVPWIMCGGVLSEGPVWDQRQERLYWTDIDRGRVYSCDLDSSRPDTVYNGVGVGGLTLQTDNSLLLFRQNDISRLNQDGTLSLVVNFHHEGSLRFNDVAADPRSRVLAGTIGKGGGSGGLFLFEVDGSYRMVAADTDCSNGLGFSPDGTILYWTCSTRRLIFAFDYDQALGRLTNQRIFVRVEAGDGIPDGLTVDASGCVYSARWGADKVGVVIYTPNGKEVARLDKPADAVTSLCFAGPLLDQLVVTTAAQADDSSARHDLYQLSDGLSPGKPEYRSALHPGSSKP